MACKKQMASVLTFIFLPQSSTGSLWFSLSLHPPERRPLTTSLQHSTLHLKKSTASHVWWLTPVVSVLRSQRQENQKSKIIFSPTVNSGAGLGCLRSCVCRRGSTNKANLHRQSWLCSPSHTLQTGNFTLSVLRLSMTVITWLSHYKLHHL